MGGGGRSWYGWWGAVALVVDAYGGFTTRAPPVTFGDSPPVGERFCYCFMGGGGACPREQAVFDAPPSPQGSCLKQERLFAVDLHYSTRTFVCQGVRPNFPQGSTGEDSPHADLRSFALICSDLLAFARYMW